MLLATPHQASCVQSRSVGLRPAAIARNCPTPAATLVFARGRITALSPTIGLAKARPAPLAWHGAKSGELSPQPAVQKRHRRQNHPHAPPLPAKPAASCRCRLGRSGSISGTLDDLTDG